MKIIRNLILKTILISAPLPCFAFNFCRVDMVQQTTEIRVFAICDGTLVADEGAGRNNLGFGTFSKVMSDLLKKDPTLKVLSCNGTQITTCFLSPR